MLPDGLEIREFDPNTATEAEFAAYTALMNELRTESNPERPPKTMPEMTSDLRSPPSWRSAQDWLVWSTNGAVAVGQFQAWHSQANQNTAIFWIGVLSSHRRHGIATSVLHLIAPAALAEGRTMLRCSTNNYVPAGDSFLKKLGAELGQTWSMSQLNIPELNHDAVHRWLNAASALQDDFELHLWEGPYPEADIATVLDMLEIMNDAPRGQLESEHERHTVEEQREWDRSQVARGIERWTLAARRRNTGEVAGYTEVFWTAAHSTELEQGDTGVSAPYRNRGIARWLKAAMIEKILRDHPQVRTIETGNAMSNQSMLHINQELGFKHNRTGYTWQVSLDRVMEYLAAKS